jgi:voltage-gated potassium channel
VSQPEFLEKRLSRLLQRPATIRASGAVIVTFTTFTVLASGALMRVFDRNEFPRYGDALWWALQTVTTVGYGDIVPHNVVGRVIGAVVMLEGIAFLTVVTAVITSIFIERARRERLGLSMPMPEEIYATIRSIEERLERIEQRLERS